MFFFCSMMRPINPLTSEIIARFFATRTLTGQSFTAPPAFLIKLQMLSSRRPNWRSLIFVFLRSSSNSGQNSIACSAVPGEVFPHVQILCSLGILCHRPVSISTWRPWVLALSNHIMSAVTSSARAFFNSCCHFSSRSPPEISFEVSGRM